jgi:broad specificity phosphatase PhoE
MRLIIVRHGETLENRRRICQGQLPGTLSEIGIAQALRVGQQLKSEPIDLCITSDLKRAEESGRWIMDFRPEVPRISDSRLRERYFGSFQGQVFPENIRHVMLAPDVESLESMYARVSSFWQELCTDHSQKTILLVSHGITIRTLVAVALQRRVEEIDDVEEIRNGSISVFHVLSADQVKIERLNDTKHLDD